MIEAEPVPETLTARAGALFDAYRSGDEASMSELVALLTPILWHTVRSQGLERESAADVVQTAWLALVRSAQKIADPAAVLQWLIVSARREAWRVGRRTQRVQVQDFEPDDILTPADDAPDSIVVRSESQSRLWSHISHLPERCRQLLRVIAFADRPDYAAIADALGMPVGSIGPTRGRCLAKLRTLLAADPGWET
jgi:RNA polymerase sigma factor (sigma-70 family)